ncbi:predicted protein [Histoplasma mississippiense (nom. inval.)]|uniref:predicted protein n=1 Tax=Ajellomyces capsulatus (strain NAm1 / WU24) TaxID=2059318 RepID=UPI000157BAD8|nr:predicted protein [Histoplasma mississippiense (nom. inval.)]EDN05685.1 predicted protein [Histoplasma mississippiense (nom. inval.)]
MVAESGRRLGCFRPSLHPEFAPTLINTRPNLEVIDRCFLMPVGRPKVPKAGRSRTASRLDSPRKLNYKAILERHEAAGRTSRLYSANAEKSRGTVRRKLQRFCSAELKTTEEEFIENLTAGRVKTYFDWLENTHRNSIKAASAFDSYWRLLKTLYVEHTGRGMDDGMAQDCLKSDGLPPQYKNIVIKRWGLRRRPKRKPSGTKDDVYRILHAHWTRCTKAYADEKQRLYVAAGILLSFISGGRLVSLFDTRIKTSDEKARDGPSKGASHTASKDSKRRTNCRRDRPRDIAAPNLYLKTASQIGQHDNRPIAPEKRKMVHSDNDEEYRDTKKTRIMAPRRSCHSTREVSYGKYGMRGEDIMYDAQDSDLDSRTNDNTDFDSGNSGESLFDELVRENDTDTELSVESVESGSTSDDVTDDEYDAGPEETGALVWRHIEFHIIQSPLAGRPNILLAKVTLLHTKGEDKKPRVKTFVISHNPEPLLDLLGHFLSMAIDDEIFAPEFKKLEDIYWYPIPSHLGGMNLKIKAEMLDVPVFRPSSALSSPLTGDQPIDESVALAIMGYFLRVPSRGVDNILLHGALEKLNDQNIGVACMDEECLGHAWDKEECGVEDEPAGPVISLWESARRSGNAERESNLFKE